MFKPDPNSTTNEMRWRLRDPSEFQKFWSTTKLVRPKLDLPPGLRAIVGITYTGRLTVQALRFHKRSWTPEQAANWWSANQHLFEKLWMEDNWRAITIEKPVQQLELLNG